jgi:hypothetical protein
MFPGVVRDPVSNTISTFLGQVASTAGKSAPVNSSHVPIATQSSAFPLAAAGNLDLRRDTLWAAQGSSPNQAALGDLATGGDVGDLPSHGTPQGKSDGPVTWTSPHDSTHEGFAEKLEVTGSTQQGVLPAGGVRAQSTSDQPSHGTTEGLPGKAMGQVGRRASLGPVSHRRMLGDNLTPAPAPAPEAESDGDDEEDDEDPEVAVPWQDFHPTLKVRSTRQAHTLQQIVQN